MRPAMPLTMRSFIAGNVIETHEHKGRFQRVVAQFLFRFQRDVTSLSNRMKVTDAVPEWGEDAVSVYIFPRMAWSWASL